MKFLLSTIFSVIVIVLVICFFVPSVNNKVKEWLGLDKQQERKAPEVEETKTVSLLNQIEFMIRR